MAKITDLDQNLVGGNEKTNLVGETVFTNELDLKAKSVLQILRQFRAYILEHAVKGDKGDTGLSVIGVSLSLTSSESTGNTYKMTCTLSDMSTIDAGTFFVPKGQKGDKGDKGDTGEAGNGISGIEKISTSGLVDTYRISFTDGTYFDFTVTNGKDGIDGAKGDKGDKGNTGNGIASIVKTGTSGLNDTYTINFTNGTHFDYIVTNGADGQTGNGITGIVKTGTVGLVDSYRINFTNGTYFDYSVTNGAKGDKGDKGDTGNGIASITKTGTAGLVDTYTITYTNGTTTTFTVTNGVDGAGTEIYVNGVAVSSVNFTSDPQTQINSKQDKISGSNPLSADLVNDTNTTNKFVRSSDITNWNNKLDKVSTSTTYPHAYIKNADGTQGTRQIVGSDGSYSANSIVERDANGCIYCQDPTASRQAVTKYYADSNFATKTLSNVTYPANTAGSTTTGSGDRVIETYISSDRNSWYRKWASGWKECGVFTGTSVGGWAYKTFTLPITFSSTDTMYVLASFVTTDGSGSGNSATSGAYQKVSANQVSVACNNTIRKTIYVCGY